MTSILHLDGLAQAELIRKGEIHPSELIELSINAIEQLNPQLNAVIQFFYDEARATAKGSLPEGPFKGVPFLVKDTIAAYKGSPTMTGTKLLSAAVADRDSTLVKRYREAGLITLGKTNLPEFGLLPVTEPTDFGATHNPWDLSRTPGGSSGGSAAAVAARIVPVAHANDGGGSIRIPASCCGLFGLKPTRGRNPLGPNFGELISGLAAEHIVSISVRDSAAMLDATAGPEPGDLYYAPPQVASYLEEVGKAPRKLKIGFTTRTPMGGKIDSQCANAASKAAQLLESLGHEVFEQELPRVFDGKTIAHMFTLMWAAGATTPLSLLKRITKQEPKPEMVEPMTWALYQIAKNTSAADYEMARLGLHRVARAIGQLFTEIDVWLSPSLGEIPVPIGEFAQSAENPMAPFLRSSSFSPFTALFNVTGQPAASVPLYWSEEGLPIGIQLVGRFGDEATLFRLSGQLEQALPWANKLPAVVA
ncbi:MAG: amidase [Bacteroidota bacterium]